MADKGIPSKFMELKTDKEKLLKQVLSFNQGLYAWGDAGTGKTVFVCSLMRELFLNFKESYFISSPKLIMELQDSYRKQGESAWDYLQEITERGILVLDDLGAAKATDFVKQALYYLINEREQWQRQTIITSNFSLTQLDEYIDSRISSRIAGMCKVVEFTGHDRRLKKGA